MRLRVADKGVKKEGRTRRRGGGHRPRVKEKFWGRKEFWYKITNWIGNLSGSGE